MKGWQASDSKIHTRSKRKLLSTGEFPASTDQPEHFWQFALFKQQSQKNEERNEMDFFRCRQHEAQTGGGATESCCYWVCAWIQSCSGVSRTLWCPHWFLCLSLQCKTLIWYNFTSPRTWQNIYFATPSLTRQNNFGTSQFTRWNINFDSHWFAWQNNNLLCWFIMQNTNLIQVHLQGETFILIQAGLQEEISILIQVSLAWWKTNFKASQFPRRNTNINTS